MVDLMGGPHLVKNVCVYLCPSVVPFLFLFFAWGMPTIGHSEKIEIEYAKGFSVEAVNGGHLVKVTPTWQGAGSRSFRYLLMPRNHTPAIQPELKDVKVIKVPVKRVVALSTTDLAYFDSAGCVDRLVGLGDTRSVNTPSVRKRIEAKELEAVGRSSTLNIEMLMDLAPDVILSTASGSIYDVHPKLMEAELPVVLILGHLEPHPLGRCEWFKFISLVLGTSDHANALFKEKKDRYNALAHDVIMRCPEAERPTVTLGLPFQGQWWIPRGESYLAQFLKDAGGNYLWSDLPGTGSVTMDIEAVYDRILQTAFWLHTGTLKRILDVTRIDARFADVAALKNGRLYNNNKRLNKNGGNDYWESGMLHPDVLLADLISILHPEMLPEHERVYYRKLESIE